MAIKSLKQFHIIMSSNDWEYYELRPDGCAPWENAPTRSGNNKLYLNHNKYDEKDNQIDYINRKG